MSHAPLNARGRVARSKRDLQPRADTPTGSNREMRRASVRNLPRAFRTSIHGWGQWRRKVVKDGELQRP